MNTIVCFHGFYLSPKFHYGNTEVFLISEKQRFGAMLDLLLRISERSLGSASSILNFPPPLSCLVI